VRGSGHIAVAGALLALGLAGAAHAGIIQVTSAGDEYAAFHPRPKAARVNAATSADFQATMDRVFGPGRWRETSGYRTPAQENALRRQGAGTVAPGHVSVHSIGAPEAPGAIDAVVDRMSAAAAAARLRQAGAGFAKVVAEGAHGGQGPHLHIELASARLLGRQSPGSADAADN
jgi:hypothetical protein